MKTRVYVFGLRGFPNVQGGVEKHCEKLYSRLAKKDYKITVFTRKSYCPDWQNVSEWQNINFIHLWSPRGKGFEAFFHSFIAAVVCLIRRPDIIHIHNIGPAIMTPLLKIFSLKVILTYHSINYHHQKWRSFGKSILKLGELFGCRYADQIITVSSVIKNHVKSKFNRDAHLIASGVEIGEQTTKIDYIESIGLTRNKYFLAVCRLVPEKGLDDLISAFSSLETDWKLVIAGDADHKTRYSGQLKHQAENNSKIVLTGFIQGDSLNEVYSHAGLFVLPSYYEGLPIALLEALSYGLGVLVSDIPPNKEIGLDENRYFPVGNKEALAEKMDYWLKNSSLSNEERTEQIEMVRQKYNWDDIAEQVLQVYKSVSDGQNKL